MYSKIAFSNVKKSIRDYTIYFLTLTFGICLFYMFNSVQAQQAVLKLNESQKSMMHLMSVIINWISVFVAVILGFLIIYANQFLMKRRHKEMGIYLLLGMEKRQVSKILLIETLLIGFFALIAGLIAGVFLSQGLAMLTAKMFAVQMKEFKFVFSQTAFIQTIKKEPENEIKKSCSISDFICNVHCMYRDSVSFDHKESDAWCGQ